MLNAFKQPIELNQSQLYLRIAFLVYLGAGVALFYSAFAIASKISIALILFYQLLKLIKNPCVNAGYIRLTYRQNQWLLLSTTQQEEKYARARVAFYGGIFLLLELGRENKKKRLVIFTDKGNEAVWRMIKIIEKLQPKTALN
ncbi:MAG: hypothetical protein WC785_01490 [Tatlockia sp.]